MASYSKEWIALVIRWY